MDAALALESRSLALQVHQLLQDLDAARFRKEMSDALQQRLVQIQARLGELVAALPDEPSLAPVRTRLGELQEVLSGWSLPEPSAARQRWMELKARMVPAYEGLVDALGIEDVHVPRLRPTNYKRNVMHMTSWIVALVTIYVSGGGWLMLAVAGGICAAGWIMEISRRVVPGANDVIMRVFNPVAHPHEAHRINSATWYATALTLLAMSGSMLAAFLAVTTLGVGDPLAAVVGRRFGKTRILNGRSLEGSTAFFVSSTLACAAVLFLLLPGLAAAHVWILAAVSSLAAAITELLCKRVDDNFAIPLVTGLVAAGAAVLLGIPLQG